MLTGMRPTSPDSSATTSVNESIAVLPSLRTVTRNVSSLPAHTVLPMGVKPISDRCASLGTAYRYRSEALSARLVMLLERKP